MGIMEIVLPAVVSFIVTAIAGKLLIPALVRLKAGQSIKEIGPTWHMTKQGTPTMGGLMFIIGIGLTIVVLGWRRMMAGAFVHLYVYLFALVFGVVLLGEPLTLQLMLALAGVGLGIVMVNRRRARS